MRFLLGLLVIFFNMIDNFTTFACLRSPIPGFEVSEANPIARWLFDSIGLLEGLLIETAVTMAAVGFLVFTQRLPLGTRLTLLTVLAALPAWAAINNLNVMRAVGIAL
jgi:hypothetical protein